MGRWIITSLLLAFLLLPGAALAQAPSSDNLSQLVDRIASLRLELNRMDQAITLVGQQRDRMARKLEALAEPITQLKDRRAKNPLLPEIELKRKLRSSQELSQTLTLFNKELDSLALSRRDKLEQLALAYDSLVEQALTGARKAEGQLRQDLMQVLARSRQERELIRKQLMPSRQSFRQLRLADMMSSDDPDELTERADAVRDEQDRLGRELARLDKRLSEIKGERRLDREMRDFISDQDIFDESSRIMVLPRTATGPAAKDDDAQRNDGQDKDGDEISDPSDGYGDDWEGALNGSGAPEAGVSYENDPQQPLTQSPDGRQALGLDESAGTGAPLQAEDKMETLEKRRTALMDRITKLTALHQDLKKKIEALSAE